MNPGCNLFFLPPFFFFHLSFPYSILSPKTPLPVISYLYVLYSIYNINHINNECDTSSIHLPNSCQPLPHVELPERRGMIYWVPFKPQKARTNPMTCLHKRPLTHPGASISVLRSHRRRLTHHNHPTPDQAGQGSAFQKKKKTGNFAWHKLS